MTTILGFLFSRWTFLILAVVVVAALVNAGKLVFNKYVIGGLVLLALGIGLWTWHDKAVKDDRVATAAPYIKLIDDNNTAAEKKLKEETAKTDAVTKALKEFSVKQEGIDRDNTKIITALNTQLRTTRLRDPYKTRGCSSSAQSPVATNTESSAGDSAGTSGELSTEFDEFLKLRFMQADKINIAYIACRADIYKVREALITETETDSGGIVLTMSEWTK